jgi:glycosyltransferase involved in cell wall biosynthesis
MTLITPSHWLADLVEQSFLKQYPIQVVHNTVNTHVFQPTEGDVRKRYGLESKKLVLGVASAWSRSKGLYDFIELSRLLPESYQIVLVGITPSLLKELPANILAIDRTNDTRELAELYTAADVFVNPSRQETFGMTTLEAISCGTKVIVYQGTACEEVVKLHGQGVVVEQSVEALKKAIEEI